MARATPGTQDRDARAARLFSALIAPYPHLLERALPSQDPPVTMPCHFPLDPKGLDGPISCLNAEALGRIVGVSRRIQVPAGSIIFREADPADGCFLIMQGAVKVTVPAGGHDALLAILGKGDIFGELAL